MILNSPYISGSLTVTNLSGSGVRYLMTSASGLLISQTADAAIKTTYTASSTAGQTVFPVTNGYSTGLVDVYLNGTKLSTSDYSDADGVNITLVTGSDAGDLLEFVKYSPALGVTNNALRQLTTFTSTEGQTVYSASYTPGLLDVYYNGSRLSSTEYTANNGTFITLATGSSAGDVIDTLVYSYQVGAFSGVGGQGVASQVAYFGTTNAITGSPNFTINGSTMTVTGSLVVSGSGTFTNIGPAVMSGSLNVSGAITTNSTITATTLIVQTVTSSNSQISGSTKFGTLSSDTHQFTGSMSVSGSVTATEGNFLGSGVDGSLGSVVRISTTNTNGNARNWALVNTFDSYGDLNFRISTAQGGNALVSGSTILTLSRTGAATFSSSVTATQLKAASSLNGDPELATFTNSNAGTGTEATIYVRNSSSNNDGTFIQALGTAFTTTGGFVQDGGVIGTGTGLSGGLSLMVRANADMRFYTNGHTNERMRITSLGDVYIGSSTTNKTSRLVVYGETTDSSQFALRTFSVGSDVLFGVRNDGLLVTGTLSLSPYNYSVTGRAVYVNSGGVIGYNSSTRESKSNINSINDISWINALNPVTFNKRKKDNEGNYIDEVYEELDYGFIADEVEQVNDNFVFYDIKDGQKVLAGVEYGKLTAVLVKAIQELKSQNDALQSRIETLESK
jgi:hypothetical protein